MSAIGLSNNNPFSNNKQHHQQQQQRNKMHSEDVDSVEEADEDCEEYKDQDDEEATTLSRFSKQSVPLENLLNLDAGVLDDEDDDDDDDGRIPPLVYREDVCSDDED
jgi:hypothetical protein